MWSLATRLPNRLVMPVSSSFSCSLLHDGRSAHRGGGWTPAPVTRSGLRGARGGRLDLAADDIGLDLCDLGLQRGRDLAGEVVVRSKPDAAVGQRADVGSALERAIGGRLHRGPGRNRDALVHAGD